jgi:hypothetical protein
MTEPHFLEKAQLSSVSFFEKAPDLVDVVSSGFRFFVLYLFSCSLFSQDVIAADIQAVPEDLLKAAEHARTMNVSDVEAIIHRIVDEVCAATLRCQIPCSPCPNTA